MDAAARPLLRSIRQRSLPVVLSRATREEGPSWSFGTISRSPTTTGDAPGPCSDFHGPRVRTASLGVPAVPMAAWEELKAKTAEARASCRGASAEAEDA